MRLCHFDPESGRDFEHAPHAQEGCESACYDCLLTYYNQRDHQLLDRKAIRDFLLQLAQSETRAAPSEKSRETHLQQLLRQAGSELESEWLGFLEEHGYRLPSHAQQLIAACGTRPDFMYQDYQAAIYIDGPYHDYPERQARDVAAVECLEDLGYFVIRFGYREDWASKIAQYPTIFGRPV